MVKSVSVIQPITGTWINLAYKDVRNKYTNPQHFDNTDPKLWTAKVRELANMGIEYLVFMEVANEGKAYYPSKLMPWVYNDKLQSPVDAILDEAARHDMKVFMSTGWAKDQDDNLLDPAIRERQLQIMEELASLYKIIMLSMAGIFRLKIVFAPFCRACCAVSKYTDREG